MNLTHAESATPGHAFSPVPDASAEEELLQLLAASGPVARLVFPPSHTLALVEFHDPQACAACKQGRRARGFGSVLWSFAVRFAFRHEQATLLSRQTERRECSECHDACNCRCYDTVRQLAY